VDLDDAREMSVLLGGSEEMEGEEDEPDAEAEKFA
jgi:hypothetical protein